MDYYKNVKNINFVTPRDGYTLATTITCVPPSDDTNFTASSYITWYFGDGEKKTVTFNEGLSATHTYLLPGTYTLSAVAYTETTDPRISYTALATQTCTITNYIDNAIYFTVIPPPTLPGFYTQYPYKVIFSTCITDTTPSIDLYSQFSRSYPPQETVNKWTFVRPEWKFVNLSGQRIKHIEPSYEEIRIDGYGNRSLTGTLVGLSGSAEFYFIDDIYSVDMFIKDAPTPIIWATLQTSAINYYLDSDIKSNKIAGYGTTEVRAYAPHVSYWRAPDYLKITENGMRDFINPRWTSASIPFFVSAQIDLTQIGKIIQFEPHITFTKYMPYAVSAQGIDYVECAEDIPVEITVVGSTSATFFNEGVPATTNNKGNYLFNQTDKYGFVAPGFAKDEVKIFDQGPMQLSAKADIVFDKLHLPVDALIYNPYIWLPNPRAGTITMIYYTGALNQQFAAALKRQFSTNSRRNIFTPLVNNINTTSQGITGFNGAYAVAASPGNEPDFEYYTWVADADLDKIYKYDTLTNLVTSIDLQAATGLQKVTPATIALDHNKELWVTCYDTLSVLKFDRNGNFLFGVDPLAHVPQLNPAMPGMFDVAPTSTIFDDVMVIEPTCIDTDVNNNVWVSYSNPISSYLMKYSSTGSFLTSIQLPVSSTPQDILIDKDNSFWVSESHEVYGDKGVLKKYDTLGNVLSAFTDIPNLGYLTYDTDGNPWFTYDYNKIGKIKNGVFTAVATVTSSYGFTNLNIPPQVGPGGYIEKTALEGIACTHKNLIFVVHTIDNSVYVYNAANDAHIDTIHITPHLMLGIFNDSNKNNHYYEQWNSSIQVIGDWTGIRWSRKYKSYYFNTKTITGTSKLLHVNKLNPTEIRKKNQNFNMAEHLASLAKSPALRSNTFLFDIFLKSIYGNADNIDDIGTVFYEKIANFLANHNDIDTCEIDKIYQLADMLDMSVDDYRLSFPFELEQVVNLLSIPHSKLWGNKRSITNKLANCRGAKLNITTYMVTEGVPVVVYDKPFNSYFLHYPATINNLTTYSTSLLTAAGFTAPIEANYELYSYAPIADNVLEGGVIDWDNPHTTLNPTISSYEDWAKDAGIIENMLNFYLYKGLKLI